LLRWNSGSSQNVTLFAELFNKSGRPVQIENCHNPVGGAKNPFFKPDADPEACPMNMYVPPASGIIGGSK
jgi:hypothetical protein